MRLRGRADEPGAGPRYPFRELHPQRLDGIDLERSQGFQIFNERDRKLETAREERRRRRDALRRQETSSPDLTNKEQVPEEAPVPAGSSTMLHSQPAANAAPLAPRRVNHLHAIRNDIDVTTVLSDLGIPTRNRGTRLTFRCPKKCAEFHTATNYRTNLARCFRCQRNFNPIDLVMAERRSTFLEAVGYLQTRFQAEP